MCCVRTEVRDSARVQAQSVVALAGMRPLRPRYCLLQRTTTGCRLVSVDDLDLDVLEGCTGDASVLSPDSGSLSGKLSWSLSFKSHGRVR